MSTRLARFDDIENALLNYVKQAGAKDATVSEIIGDFYPRAFVWARRASAEPRKVGAREIEHRILYEVVIEYISADVKTAYQEVKRIYFAFYDLIWNDPTLGSRCIRAVPVGFERASLKQENRWLEQWAALVEVVVEL